MRTRETPILISGAAPSSPATAIGNAVKSGWLVRADGFVVDADITAGTGGTLDIALQRQTMPGQWLDWLRFPLVPATTTKHYSFAVNGEGGSIWDVGGGTDASPGVSLTPGTFVNANPGATIRVIATAGTGTSAAGSFSIAITPTTSRH